jgi:hypothetical protein
MLLQNALLFGVLLSVLIVILMVASSAVALDMWLDDYPPDIKAKYGAMSEKGKRVKPFVAVVLIGTMLGVLALSLVRLHAVLGRDFTFGEAFASAFLVALIFNVFDLIVLDWLLFVIWTPRFIVLPGTEGMAGYKDLGFHVRGFLKGLAFSVVMGLIGATVGVGLQMVI